MAPSLRTFRAVVAYDGTDFHGWQVQGALRTVQGVVEGALERTVGERVPVLAAGRTDAGVHAEGQLISFRAATAIPPEGLAAALNARLPEDVAVLTLERAPAAFHATRDARSKIYRYDLLDRRVPDPLRRRASWRIPVRLDERAMRRAARVLVGRHDFRSFRSNPGPAYDGQGTIRTIHRIDVRRRGDRVTVEVEGDGFLHNMVRNLVGTLVQAGRGRWTAARVREALEARDRARAGPAAPARGLTLVSVAFGAPRRRGRKAGVAGKDRPRRPAGA